MQFRALRRQSNTIRARPLLCPHLYCSFCRIRGKTTPPSFRSYIRGEKGGRGGERKTVSRFLLAFVNIPPPSRPRIAHSTTPVDRAYRVRTLVYSRYKGSNARTPISMRAPLICALHIHPFHQSVPLLARVLPFFFFFSFLFSINRCDRSFVNIHPWMFPISFFGGEEKGYILCVKKLLLSLLLVLDVL